MSGFTSSEEVKHKDLYAHEQGTISLNTYVSLAFLELVCDCQKNREKIDIEKL